MNREQWLSTAVAQHYRPSFRVMARVEIPPVLVSIGFPMLNPRSTSGECWPRRAASQPVNLIFLSPRLAVHRMLETLTHELVHAVLDAQGEHGPAFQELAARVDLRPMESWAFTRAGLGLRAFIERTIEIMPEWPGVQLNIGGMS